MIRQGANVMNITDPGYLSDFVPDIGILNGPYLVDDFEQYVSIQAEAAIRHVASQFAYDEGDDLDSREITLRAGADEVMAAMIAELQARLQPDRNSCSTLAGS